ncbi:hypothetical protein [Synechococcus sp. EJ6-Ellesmere]|uniref:hypothetical protein n=1 Tax=Synechococcus sp. EJ6-Ellesmere TaxID=2823734 RepID=UPI0020CD79D4|nr:hypothetical protein [Synechococcus sp. EJ6-Ellesmere]MCP9826017.1 hypothetical protein [Synechococcus sp. EJ6-Ellesmere]
MDCSFAPHTLLIQRREFSGLLVQPWCQIRQVITPEWRFSHEWLGWMLECPPAALTFSRVGPVVIAHGGSWARIHALESLRWPLLDRPVIHGKALAVAPDRSSGSWQALTGTAAQRGKHWLWRLMAPLTPTSCPIHAAHEMQLTFHQLQAFRAADEPRKLELLLQARSARITQGLIPAAS